MPLTGTVLRMARQDPDRPAIVADGHRISYAELVSDSRRMIAAVRELHEGQAQPPVPAAETGGIPVTAVSTTSAFHTARIVAGLAGYRAVSATIDPRWPLDHQVGVIATTGIGLVISDSAGLAAALRIAGWTGNLLSLDAFRAAEAAQYRLAEPPAVRDGQEPFLMLFSSGTTRNPKAFLKTRTQYRANYAVSSAHLEPLPGVVTVAPGPVSYSLTLYALIECLASGGTACLADVFDPIETGRVVSAESAGRMVVVPAMVQALAYAAKRDPERFESLRLIVTGGANLSAKTRGLLAATLPKVRLISYYGAAEIGFIGDSRDGDGTAIDIYDGIHVRVAGEDGSPADPGDLGTIWVQAAACSTGYLAGTSTETLRGDGGWATVHDQGRIVDGRLVLAGRAGDIAITGGHKVSLAEVERVFDALPGLGPVCAVAIPDDRLGSIIALVVESADDAPALDVAEDVALGGAPGPAPSRAAMVAHARQHLAPQFVPHRWYAVAEMPRTVGGKIRRGAVADMVTASRDVVRL